MFKKSNFFLTILILILGLALNSFSSTKGLETASNNQVLKNTKWELKSLNKKDIEKIEPSNTIILVVVRFGNVRLLDNIWM